MYDSRSTTLLNTSHPHHRQGSELPTGDHISASISSLLRDLVPHASLSGQNAGCSRTGRSPAAGGYGPASLMLIVPRARPQRPPRASKHSTLAGHAARGTSTNGMDSSAPAVLYTATSTAPQSQKTGMELFGALGHALLACSARERVTAATALNHVPNQQNGVLTPRLVVWVVIKLLTAVYR